ncbi:ABC transporter permease [candidate division KSB1 bacterium]
MNKKTDKSAKHRLIKYFLIPVGHQSIIGDLEELHAEMVGEKGGVLPRFWYFGQILMLIFSFFISEIFWNLVMIKNYMKTAKRNLLKNKGYSFINIASLSIGVACCILLFLYIDYELSWDKFHKNADRIFRVAVLFDDEDGLDPYAKTQAPLAPAMLDDFPEVEEAVRISTRFPGGGGLVANYGGKQFWEERILLADQSFFKVFSFPLINGNTETALTDPSSVVISKETAAKYFGNEDPLGKVINFYKPGGYNESFIVTGVICDIPKNSQFQFDLLFSFALQGGNLNWTSWNYTTYVMLLDEKYKTGLEGKFPEFTRKYLGDEAVARDKFFLQPILDIHLHSQLRNDFSTNRSIVQIYFLSSTALLILLIACINYMNLMTVRSLSRAKEVGIRKAVGAQKFQLVKQFLGESVLFSSLAVCFGLLLAELFLPAFNNLVGEELDIIYLGNYSFLSGIVLIAVIVGVAAGSYPAVYISSFKPAMIFRDMTSAHKPGKARTLTKAFVIFQFAISIFFIICTFIVKGQMNYIMNRDLGYEKANLIVIPFYDRDFHKKTDIIKNEFLSSTLIESVSAASYLPSDQGYYQSTWWEGMPENETEMFHWFGSDHDLVQTFQLNITEGRDFSKLIKSDSAAAYILNRSAVEYFGWENPIGKKMEIIDPGTVVGVIDDFNFKSLYDPIEPMAIYLFPAYKYLYVRISEGNMSEGIKFMTEKWEEIIPGMPFNYSFLDEDFERIYKSDIKLGRVFGYVTSLTFIIACLGLFGLVYFFTERRIKEIGIRKVLGASVFDIVKLIAKEFMLLVLFANVIALPFAVYFRNSWLENFAFKMSFSFHLFIIAVISSFLIAFLTISFQSVKAALSNPVDVLKYE